MPNQKPRQLICVFHGDGRISLYECKVQPEPQVLIYPYATRTFIRNDHMTEATLERFIAKIPKDKYTEEEKLTMTFYEEAAQVDCLKQPNYIKIW